MLDSWTFNKIAGAVLGTALMVFGLSEVSGMIYHPIEASKETPGYKIEVAETPQDGAGEPAAAVPIGTLLASADAAKGASEAKICLGCHVVAKGDATQKTGPNLWDVVERPKASVAGYQYSEGMAAKASEAWTYEDLNAFLANPKAAVPGTKMAWGGQKNDAKRANLIAYLASLSDAPKPFPAP
jgi:cytochrome c